MSDQKDRSPTVGRIPHRRGATHARIRGKRPGKRGSSPAAITTRNRRALAALDRWQLEHATVPADSLAAFAAYGEWIRAEIRLMRRLGQDDSETMEVLTGGMHRWALQIDQNIRTLLGEPS